MIVELGLVYMYGRLVMLSRGGDMMEVRAGYHI